MVNNLSFEELTSIAELKYNRGFNLLLECLQAFIDTLSNELCHATPEKELQVLARWRVHREIYSILKEQPESLSLELEQNKQVKEDEEDTQLPSRFISPNRPLPPQQLDRLKKAYEVLNKKNLTT